MVIYDDPKYKQLIQDTLDWNAELELKAYQIPNAKRL